MLLPGRECNRSFFTELLAKKSLDRITVGEIIERADVGRATFYAHFETKDFLLRELFCHVFDAAGALFLWLAPDTQGPRRYSACFWRTGLL